MRVLLYQFDGEFPNLALMRISAHHKERGDTIRLKKVGNIDAALRACPLEYDKVYGSLIFKRSRPLAELVRSIRPDIMLGGSGIDDIPEGREGLVSIVARKAQSTVVTLAGVGITTKRLDYTLYPQFEPSIGFTQRGCRMGCVFCDVPVKEGKVAADQLVNDIWRGAPWPKKLILWDNDTFGNPDWRNVFRSILDGGYKVSFNQGVNARLMNEENAEALANTPCYNARFDRKCWYTAWDNRNDEDILFRGLRWLVKYGVSPRNIVVYMLIGYWTGETGADREYRRRKLREFGAFPYPMPFVRTRELVGFQRWVMGSYDKRGVSWAEWEHARYQPRNLQLPMECVA